jgi:hypothetical protein
MISIIHYISACRRLKEAEKTVMMLGGERECQEMILAQRDMIKLEKEYYHDEVMKWAFSLLIVGPASLFALVVYYKFFH